MYVLSLNMWFQKLMRQFFFNIDSIVFNFISSVYDLLISIARTSVLSQADIIDMADRIYKLLAIFMVFKVTFSLIMYVVNPDDFSDKSKGISKLGTNIIISLTLLILTPYAFNMAYTLQTIVLEDNSIAALIFGDDSGQNEFLNTAGDSMAFIAIRPFFMPNVSIDKMADCTTLDDACFTGMEKLLEDNSNFTNTMLTNYRESIKVSNLGLMFRQDLSIATDKDNNNFIMDYKYIFSTVIGVVIILLLITFCMDVAVRSIKLAFLQLVAPIPIISYVDPKSGKDGLFKKWYQMCFKTYLSLFIRILALYFAIYIISKIGKMVDIVDGSYQTNGFIAIFIIIGALMFAKQLPKILEGLGIKLDGGFQLNPLKKIEKDAIGGKALSKAAGVPFKYAGRAGKGLAAAGLVGGAAVVTGQGLRGMGKAFGGALKGEKFGKNFSSSYSAARARKKQVDEMREQHISPSDVRKANLKNRFRGMTDAEKVSQLESKAKAIQTYYDNIKNQAIACDSNDTSYIYDENGNRVQKKSAKTLSKELEEMKKTQIDRTAFSDIKDSNGKTLISAEDQYNEAITQQRLAIKSKEGELEARINSLANNEVRYEDSSGREHFGTGVASADKVIAESRSTMGKLAHDVNETGKAIDDKFVTISEDITDVVTMMKQSKGAVAQTTSGKMSDIKDIAKYTQQTKK